MSRVPDRPVGFKYLYVPYDGQPHSPMGTAWDENGVIYAKCDRLEREKTPLPDCEMMPNENCQCGIYGAFDLSLCNKSDDWCRALFLIEGLGKCIVSANGFRAELARIVCVVRTPWCVVDYNKITVYPIPPRISLDAAVMAISEHRAQWLALNESGRFASVAPMVNSRRVIKAIPRTSRSMVKSS